MSGEQRSSVPLTLPDALPLRFEKDGTARIGRSRVTLDVVIDAFESGQTPEGIVRTYDALDLADVYEVIAWYLRHRDEVKGYLDQRGREAEALRATIEAAHPRLSREQLETRRTEEHAPPRR